MAPTELTTRFPRTSPRSSDFSWSEQILNEVSKFIGTKHHTETLKKKGTVVQNPSSNGLGIVRYSLGNYTRITIELQFDQTGVVHFVHCSMPNDTGEKPKPKRFWVRFSSVPETKETEAHCRVWGHHGLLKKIYPGLVDIPIEKLQKVIVTDGTLSSLTDIPNTFQCTQLKADGYASRYTPDISKLSRSLSLGPDLDIKIPKPKVRIPVETNSTIQASNRQQDTATQQHRT